MSQWKVHTYTASLCIVAAAGVALPSLVASPVVAAPENVRAREYWLDDLGITKAWEVTKGENVKVAVIDSGVDGAHPDLTDSVAGGTDVSGSGKSDGQKGIGEDSGHGTLVASLLAGRGHGGKPIDVPRPDGLVGVAPGADILSVSAWLGSPNPAGKSTDEQVPEAIRWAVDNGARVINMSMSSPSPSWPPSWDAAFLYAQERDVVIVAAAGNRGTGNIQVGAPATIPGVVAVAGLRRDGTASATASAPGITIAVSAPGEKLIGATSPDGYAEWEGSSGAAPIVAGVAALIRSRYPDMPAAEVINRIIRTAKPAGEPPFPNNHYGWGIIDAQAAVNDQVEPVKNSLLPSLKEWITLHRRGTAPPPAPTGGHQGYGFPSPPPVTVPQPAAPPAPDGRLPATVVLLAAALTVTVAAAGGCHLLSLRRRLTQESEAAHLLDPLMQKTHLGVKATHGWGAECAQKLKGPQDRGQ